MPLSARKTSSIEFATIVNTSFKNLLIPILLKADFKPVQINFKGSLKKVEFRLVKKPPI